MINIIHIAYKLSVNVEVLMVFYNFAFNK